MSVEQAYQTLYSAAFCVLVVLIGIMLVRSVIGPRITDRIMSVNMLSTMVICSIAILSQLLRESYLLDVALIYALISFTAVMMMATMYIAAEPKAPVFPGEKAGDGGSGGEGRDEAPGTGGSGSGLETSGDCGSAPGTGGSGSGLETSGDCGSAPGTGGSGSGLETSDGSGSALGMDQTEGAGEAGAGAHGSGRAGDVSAATQAAGEPGAGTGLTGRQRLETEENGRNT